MTAAAGPIMLVIHSVAWRTKRIGELSVVSLHSEPSSYQVGSKVLNTTRNSQSFQFQFNLERYSASLSWSSISFKGLVKGFGTVTQFSFLKSIQSRTHSRPASVPEQSYVRTRKVGVANNTLLARLLTPALSALGNPI